MRVKVSFEDFRDNGIEDEGTTVRRVRSVFFFRDRLDSLYR